MNKLPYFFVVLVLQKAFVETMCCTAMKYVESCVIELNTLHFATDCQCFIERKDILI
jgi:hypothetical protein